MSDNNYFSTPGFSIMLSAIHTVSLFDEIKPSALSPGCSARVVINQCRVFEYEDCLSALKQLRQLGIITFEEFIRHIELVCDGMAKRRVKDSRLAVE